MSSPSDLLAVCVIDREDGVRTVKVLHTIKYKGTVVTVFPDGAHEQMNAFGFCRETGRLYRPYTYNGELAADVFPDLADQFLRLMDLAAIEVREG